MPTLTAATAAQAAPQAAPSVHRRALITWLAVYPTITAAFLLLGPSTAHLPLALRTLVMTAIVVPAAVYVLVPALLKADHKATAALNSARAGAE
ncbi:hypothetical protein ABZ638_30610 [Streptomyces sp. NPDC007107]|uniref:hypothetical protein n=1 Tax=Streptomyces sp. NPDC007107 TaxID=3156915 RepID=UPI0033F82097